MNRKEVGTIQKSLLWSGSSEMAVKLIVPISNMLLARILTPEYFGVLAICIMVISFLDIITDAGFGKYLVQYDFKDENQRDECANVAFWSNLALSFFLCAVVVVNSEWIAELLGGKKYSTVISVSCLQLVFTSMVSIQMGLLRRDFQFKKLFVARIGVTLVPLVVTVPLALITKSYWALIIGNISGSVINAVILLLGSKWKPRLFYSFELLKQMFSFSFWSLCEALAHWFIFWVDTFIVVQFYSSYYLGIYKNSANMIMSLIGMIIAATSPVLLSVLSRIKDEKEFYSIFLHIEKIIMYILFPMGIGIFFYRETITTILFGAQWAEASNIIGAWALMMVVSVVIYSFPAEAFKAKGIPKILFFYQISYLAFLIPVCILTAKIDFWTFVYARALSIAVQVVLCMIFLHKFLHWNIVPFIKNMGKPAFASVSVLISCILFKKILPGSFMLQIFSIFIIIVVYFAILYVFFKKDIMSTMKIIQEKKINKKV
ncbi:lipopolysaccharide biosynthesis protein [Schinkia azotoformans]|uniref:lipopolysaccharide biosynthesis protein n=1 Tax=Schinkia azotoformans TaxID=1454 RepID=UPI002DB6578E|nr:lipopolysaccharide biosynthesis protein [Schinkia azotoformans]MEC1747887.1 lipopolysaccharide biosynthesis protein [Schinkia azotoformans]